MALSFEVLARSRVCGARAGRVATPHGSFDTPAFMPVGTQGTVKGLLPHLVAESGAQVILCNTYHLMLRPGADRVARLGGLHEFCGWRGPILTDSGGFQAFSLSDLVIATDQGVTFRSHIDGSLVELTPERAIDVQHALGADIIMALDDCPPASADGEEAPGSNRCTTSYAERVAIANRRTAAWLERCRAAHQRAGRESVQALFGIVQGGTDEARRRESVEQVCNIDLPGYAIGGVAVGEAPQEIARIVNLTAPLLPDDKPRYLMGVGYERDILTAVRAGVDMFDCVLPTRNGRNANAFTPCGQIRLRNARFADDPDPIERGCDCLACAGTDLSRRSGGGRGFSRAYLRHLFLAGEMLGPILVSLHNVRYFQRLLLDIRATIRNDDWSALGSRWPVLSEFLPVLPEQGGQSRHQ